MPLNRIITAKEAPELALDKAQFNTEEIEDLLTISNKIHQAVICGGRILLIYGHPISDKVINALKDIGFTIEEQKVFKSSNFKISW
jgi:hypothetical protein